MKVIFLILLIVAVVAIAPLITVWAISTLWNFDATYDFWNWLAALVLGGGLFASGNSKK